MAVQAHYASNPLLPDFRKRSRDALLAELQLQQQQQHEPNANAFLGGFNYAGQVLNGNTVFSDPESELTCNLSAPRKRSRDQTQQINLAQHQQQMLHQFRLVNHQAQANSNKVQEKSGTISTGLQLSYEENRPNQSGGTSTSGRSQTTTPFAQDLMACLYQQNDEIDALIRLQSERLRLGLEEKRRRHYRSLLSFLEQQIVKKLRDKDMELENARARNAELEEKVKQMSLENQIWQNVARNNEAIVANLKSSLERVLLQGMGQSREGYGDSEAIPSPAGADDAQSCCFEGLEDVQARAAKENEELRHRRTCRVCRENETSVLLLPCRHLCLCKDCDSRLDCCPVCNAKKSASLQVYMS
ncbi:probable BOI-related E3 ubiquitin-protein ligase 2 [Nymphaea colorata]|nr:probable BOI-related E3 ubiquitin-protein ligase 2 [Nymphaea colorata]